MAERKISLEEITAGLSGFSDTDMAYMEKQKSIGGGLSPKVLLLNGKGIQKGLSDLTLLQYFVDNEYVSIWDESSSRQSFYSTCIRGEMAFSVYNKNYRNIPEAKHPDILPSTYLYWSLQHYQMCNNPVESIYARWVSSSDNFKKYRQTLAQTDNPTSEQKVNAAFFNMDRTKGNEIRVW